MSFREAAVLPVAYLTAYILLFEIGNIKPNQTLLFHSAGGGVGGKIIIETLKIAIKKIFFS
jgi:NADPH:quinone reductase-like Zn-dependent oxidoreductase